MKKRLLILAFMLFSISGIAQELTVEAPSVVTSSETFRIVFSANGKISDFNWPGTNDFSIVYGPQKGSSSSVTIINGKRESKSSESYTYVLQPLKEGTFTLPAATATIDKKEYTSGAFNIEVVNDDQQGQQQQTQQTQQNQQGQQQALTTGSVSDNDIFLRLSLSKTNVVKGEPIVASLTLYTRADIAGFENIKFPTFNGFWSKETFTPQNIEFNRENINGKIYNSAILRKYMLIPQQTGSITIDPAELVCLLRVRASSGGSRTIFDDFFDNYQTIRKRLTTKSATINVKPLPAGAPASFAGGVGDFKISAKLSSDTLSSNEAGSLIVTISGTGNISMLEAPTVTFPPDFEVYDVKGSEKISADGTKGSKTYEYPFIPRSYGNFTIDPIEYSFYNISKNGYITTTAPGFTIKVGKGSEVDNGGVVIPGVVKQSVKNLGEDVRFIATGVPALKNKGTFFVGSALFYILIAVIILLYFVAVRLLAFTAARREDIAGSRKRKANKMARLRLKQANEYLKKDISSAFYEELHKAILGYMSDKLVMPVSELSKEKIEETLKERNVPEQLITSSLDIIDACEFARYAPDASSEAMENHYTLAVKVISELEGNVKNKNTVKKNSNVESSSFAFIMILAATSLTAITSQPLNAQTLTLPSEQASDTVAVVTVPGPSDEILSGSDESTLWGLGNEAFTKEEYSNALAFFKAIEKRERVSAALYYNIGNTYFKMDDMAHAILYFERALKINPRYSDAKNNLIIAQGSVLDKIEKVPDFILVTWVKNVKYMISSDVWAKISLVLFLAVALLFLGFKFFPYSKGRKISFIFAWIVLFFAVLSLLFSISEKRDNLHENQAIVISAVSSVKSSPARNGKSIFILHEGTKIELLDDLGEWKKIELADGRQGWLLTSEIEKI